MFVPLGGTVVYAVMFENKSDATAPARLITVTDTLDPNLDLNTFELFEIAFANFTFTVLLTHVDMTLEVPAGRLKNVTLEALLPEICRAAIEPGPPLTPSLSPSGGEGGAPAPGEGVTQPYLLRFTTCTNQSLMGTQQLAWLHFTAVCAQSSAFVNLQIPDTVGMQPDGTPVRNFAAQAGRVVVVGAEPLLEAFMNTNGRPALVLYGQVGTNCVIEANPDLGNPSGWQPTWQGTMPDLFQVIEPAAIPSRMLFFRARRE